MTSSLALEWTSKLADLYAHERQAMVQFLLALAEFDERELWRDLGHRNLFAFLHDELHLANGPAYCRKTAVGLIRRFPAVVDGLRDGRLCMSTVCELAKVITDDNWQEVLPRFYGCSRRDAEKVAVSIAPVQDPPTRVVFRLLPPPVFPPAETDNPPSTPERLDLAPVAPRPAPRDVVRPLTPQLARMALTVSESFLQDLEQVQDLMASDFPSGDVPTILQAGLKLLLEKAAKRRALVKKPRSKKEAPAPLEPTDAADVPSVRAPEPISESSEPTEVPPERAPATAAAPSTPRSRHIPAEVKREVWQRDEGRCQWPLASGGVCGARRYLEFDHIVPWARGGPSTVGNIRLACTTHNLQHAREVFGDAWMDSFRRRKDRHANGTTV